MKRNVAFTLISFVVLKWDDCLSDQLTFELLVQIPVHLLIELWPNLLPCGPSMMDYRGTSGNLWKPAAEVSCRFPDYFTRKKKWKNKCTKEKFGNLRNHPCPFLEVSSRFPDNPSLTDHTVEWGRWNNPNSFCIGSFYSTVSFQKVSTLEFICLHQSVKINPGFNYQPIK